MVAAEEMGHKGVRAMSPLDSALANALRVKLGKGRDLPEAPKPKRVPKPKEEGVAKPASRGKKPKTEDDALAEVKPAATIVKPKRPAPPPRPSRLPAGPFAPPRVTIAPARPAPPPPPPRIVAPSPPAPVRPAVVAPPAASGAPAPMAPAAVATAVIEAPPAAPVEVKRELIRVPESVTVGELAERMRRKS